MNEEKYFFLRESLGVRPFLSFYLLSNAVRGLIPLLLLSPIIAITGDSDTYLIGTLHFDSLNAIKTAFASEQGQACAADRKILAPDDDKIRMYLFDTVDV